MSIRVVVVDDSAFMRKIISDKISQIKGIDVCGIARDGQSALKMIEKQQPDVITLDIEMPGLNGLETLKIIKERFNIPVIMLSSHSGEDMTITSLELGAMDFIEKPQNLLKIEADFVAELELKIKSISKANVLLTETKSVQSPLTDNNEAVFPKKIRAIVIGASTGGPRALMQLIKYIPADLRIPILIVQHMPAGFTTSFSKRLNQEAQVPVVEAVDNELIQGGKVYIAPGNHHLRLEDGRIKLGSPEEAKAHGVRPAVDYLFETAAQCYQKELVGIILTGMGNDGTAGLRVIKELGGYTIAQDQKSSVVFGMPRRAIESHVIDEIGNLEEIGERLNWMIRVKQWR